MANIRRVFDITETEEYEFDLYNEAGSFGEVKTTQPPLHDKFEASGFTIRIRCMNRVYGHLNGPASPAASLVVVKITLGNKSDDCQRFYRKFCAKFTLESDIPHDPIDEPYVMAFEPAGKGAIRVADTTAHVTEGTEHGVSGGVQADSIPVTMDATISKTKQEEFEKESAYTVVAETDQTVGGGGGREGDNIVEWTCRADPRQTSGVGDFISFALLVHLSEDKIPFLINLDIEATVDWRYWMADKWKSLTNQRKKRYLPLRISNTSTKDVPGGIDPEHLQDTQLRELGFIHVPEKQAPHVLYQ